MKVLIILGAAKNGNTTEIVRYFKQQLKDQAHYEFEDLYLEDHSIDFCTGCHNCICSGEHKCPHYQGIKYIEDKILASDIVILATPGYMFSVTGIMKNFLDHVAYNCHRPKYFGKKIYLISSCTKWQEKGVFIPMQTWSSAAGFSLVGKLYVEMLPIPFSEQETTKRRNKIIKAAFQFDKAVRKEKTLKPDLGGIMVFHAFRTLSRLCPNILKADYKYFKEKKAYEKQTKWYVEATISPIKHAFANFMEKKMEKSMVKMCDQDKLKSANGMFRNKL